MARIRDIRLIPLAFQMPQIKAYGMARRLVASRGATLVEVETEDGVIGLGEAWGPAKAAAAYLEVIRDEFVGSEIYDHAHVWSRIISGMYHLGVQNQMTALASGINIAIYDAIGKDARPPGVQAARRQGQGADPGLRLGRLSDPRSRQPAGGAARAGGRQGLSRCQVQDRHQPEVRRGAVALPAYPRRGGAAPGRRQRQLHPRSDAREHAPHRAVWHPLLRGAAAAPGRRRLQGAGRRAPIAIAAGEALYTVFDFARLMSARAVDVVQPDLTLCGGLDQAKAIAVLCQLHNIGLSPHVWGSPVGLAAALHFMAALPDYPHTDHLPHPRMVEYDVGENPLRDTCSRTLCVRSPATSTCRTPPGSASSSTRTPCGASGCPDAPWSQSFLGRDGLELVSDAANIFAERGGVIRGRDASPSSRGCASDQAAAATPRSPPASRDSPDRDEDQGARWCRALQHAVADRAGRGQVSATDQEGRDLDQIARPHARRLEHAQHVAPGLLDLRLGALEHLAFGRDPDLAGDVQPAGARRRLDAVAVAGERRPPSADCTA